MNTELTPATLDPTLPPAIQLPEDEDAVEVKVSPDKEETKNTVKTYTVM